MDGGVWWGMEVGVLVSFFPESETDEKQRLFFLLLGKI